MEQRSPEWFAARCGKVTASRVADLMARTKTGWGASRANYMAELVAERLTGVPAQGFTNAAMAWGVENECHAREAYAAHMGCEVVEIGFVDHPEIQWFGASPDGLVGSDGLMEAKCPNTSTHIDTLLSQSVPAKYITQMQVQMACTDRAWCDFVSYDPRMPADLRLFVQRIDRDVSAIVDLETEVSAFLRELDAKVEQLRSIRSQGQRVANNGALEAA